MLASPFHANIRRQTQKINNNDNNNNNDNKQAQKIHKQKEWSYRVVGRKKSNSFQQIAFFRLTGWSKTLIKFMYAPSYSLLCSLPCKFKPVAICRKNIKENSGY